MLVQKGGSHKNPPKKKHPQVSQTRIALNGFKVPIFKIRGVSFRRDFSSGDLRGVFFLQRFLGQKNPKTQKFLKIIFGDSK